MITWSGPAARLAVVSLVAVGCGSSAIGTPASGGWTALPPPPVSPRTGSAVAWTGTEALFLGGTVGGLCPPTASCLAPEQKARDGAAYDPATATWRRTAAAPVDLPGHGRAAVVGRTVYLVVGKDLLVYDASEDTWRTEPGPPGPADGSWSLTASVGTVVAARTEQRPYAADQVYDQTSHRWAPLPRDPLVPSFDRELTSTPYGLVLTGLPQVDQPGSELATALTHAALLDLRAGTWRLLPVSDQLGGIFTWTGRRLVAPALAGADGGQVNPYGRRVPYGGTLELPAGVWGRLPNAPKELTGGWSLTAFGGPRIATEGWFYDDDLGSWTTIPKPDGAPEQVGAAVWAGDRLVVLGGFSPDAGYTEAGLSNQAFSYRP